MTMTVSFGPSWLEDWKSSYLEFFATSLAPSYRALSIVNECSELQQGAIGMDKINSELHNAQVDKKNITKFYPFQ